jgi:hypothetical protein
MIVGFTLGVVQVYRKAANIQGHSVRVGLVRLGRAFRQKLLFTRDFVSGSAELTKLSFIDDLIVAVGIVVALKTPRDIGMPAYAWSWLVAAGCVRNKSAAPSDMIYMTVRVDDRVEAILLPPPYLLDYPGAALWIRGVERYQPVVRFEQDRMREGFHDRHPVSDLGELVVDAVYRANHFCPFCAFDHGIRHRQQIRHDFSSLWKRSLQNLRLAVFANRNHSLAILFPAACLRMLAFGRSSPWSSSTALSGLMHRSGIALRSVTSLICLLLSLRKFLS